MKHPPTPDQILRWIASGLVWLLLGIAVLWAFGALWFDLPQVLAPQVLAPQVLACLFLAAVGVTATALKPRWRAKLCIAVAVLAVLAWWQSLKPQQYRDWKTTVVHTARADLNGDLVMLRNVRDFDYRSEDDYTPRWHDRRVDLRNLRGVDLFITYWGSPYMAHPIISFDFGPDGRVCFSIETRPEKGESYSALGGLYRQFELNYVVAEERDVIRLRTNYRKGEDVYLYRLNAPRAREAFLEYVRAINELHEAPRWYNAITNNCTTGIRNQRATADRQPWDWRMLVNGLGDQLLYERGAIDRSLPFADLRKRAHINARARAADADPDFSARIREGIPGMDG